MRKFNRIIVIGIALALLIYGFSTDIHPYDYMACGMGGVMFGGGLFLK